MTGHAVHFWSLELSQEVLLVTAKFCTAPSIVLKYSSATSVFSNILRMSFAETVFDMNELVNGSDRLFVSCLRQMEVAVKRQIFRPFLKPENLTVLHFLGAKVTGKASLTDPNHHKLTGFYIDWECFGWCDLLFWIRLRFRWWTKILTLSCWSR